MRFRLAGALFLVAASGASAQHEGHGDHAMDHSMHMMHMQGSPSHRATAQPAEAGQDAFAAIQEIVALLEADPATDWSKVDIDALRDHLVDMNRVILNAKVERKLIEGGIRYRVTGEGDVVGSIKRMVPAHAQQVSADSSWQASTSELSNGVTLTITTAAHEVAKIRALGFAGFMVQGNHHQPHHLMMSKGEMDHAHHH